MFELLEWIRTERGRVPRYFYWLAATIATLQFMVVLFRFVEETTPGSALLKISIDNLIKPILLAQTFVIAILVVFRIKLPDMNYAAFPRPIQASEQFLKFWYAGWISWLALYFIWFLSYTESFAAYQKPVGLLLDFLNLFASCFFFLCYLVMVTPSVSDESRSRPTEWYYEVSLVFIGCAGIIAVEWSILNLEPEVSYLRGFEGLLSGIALAFLVGRFDGKFVNAPRGVTAALYAYAIIQISYPELSDKPLNLLVLTSFALVLKVVLFFQMRSIVNSLTLTTYMIEYPKIYMSAEENKNKLRRKLRGDDTEE